MAVRLMLMFFRVSLAAMIMAAALFAQENPSWTKPFPPHRVIGNVYYVGSKGLAAYLITTPEGNILINSNLESSVAMLRQNVEKLGFKFSDTKILLISHAHWDHCAGSAGVKAATGAQYMVMDADVGDIETGGKENFHYRSSPGTYYKPTKVDRVLHDRDEVKLGNVTLVAQLTPGHTKGCTTWTLKVNEGGKTYNVVIVGSPNVNEGYRLVNNPLYPNIAKDYEHTFAVLNALPCDVFLGAHGDYYNLSEKYPRLTTGGANPFIDPDGYRRYVTDREAAFRAELKKQSQASR